MKLKKETFPCWQLVLWVETYCRKSVATPAFKDSAVWKNTAGSGLLCVVVWKTLMKLLCADGKPIHKIIFVSFFFSAMKSKQKTGVYFRNNYIDNVHSLAAKKFHWKEVLLFNERLENSSLASRFWIRSSTFQKVTDTLSCTIHAGADYCVEDGDWEKVEISMKCMFFLCVAVTKHVVKKKYSQWWLFDVAARCSHLSPNCHEYFKRSSDSGSHFLLSFLFASHITTHFNISLVFQLLEILPKTKGLNKYQNIDGPSVDAPVLSTRRQQRKESVAGVGEVSSSEEACVEDGLHEGEVTAGVALCCLHHLSEPLWSTSERLLYQVVRELIRMCRGASQALWCWMLSCSSRRAFSHLSFCSRWERAVCSVRAPHISYRQGQNVSVMVLRQPHSRYGS